ncbi:DUF4129 domain-containing protein [Microlunatus ginsengisoli]|uniref:Protein-glutamine gamma-glutamyltransferase-like C-terminal domain-containing protein n=1 Tax=Microlunatus ginsengisoli TaxID=363863 RepID=A0ABP6ZG12_9ACTN
MRRVRTGTLALVFALLTGLVAVVAAAAGGPWTISDRSGLWSPGSLPEVRPPQENPAPLGGRSAEPVMSGEPPHWLTWAMLIGIALLTALLLVWLWRRLAERFRGRHELEIEADTLPGEVRPDAPVIRAGLISALDELSVTGNPTDAVLRAWVALEHAAARSGVGRKPSDTPTEFTARVLATTKADRESIDALLRLYHQARFSWHGLSAADREHARACLQGLAASWSAFETPDSTTDAGSGR